MRTTPPAAAVAAAVVAIVGFATATMAEQQQAAPSSEQVATEGGDTTVGAPSAVSTATTEEPKADDRKTITQDTPATGTETAAADGDTPTANPEDTAKDTTTVDTPANNEQNPDDKLPESAAKSGTEVAHEGEAAKTTKDPAATEAVGTATPNPVDDNDFDEELPMADYDESTTPPSTPEVPLTPVVTTEKPEENATTKPTEKPQVDATVAPTAPPSMTPAPVTTKPLLRTDAAVSDSSTLNSHLNQGSPLLLVSFAAICCVFLILWVRKRKYSGGASSPASGVGSSAGSSSSSKIASKVQYSRIENKQDNIFGADDDDDEDDFENDRNDKWDDWEGDMGRLSDEGPVTTNAYQSALYSHPNPFAAAAVSSSQSLPLSPELSAHSGPQFHINPPPAPLQQQHTRGAAELHEIVVSTPPKESSPGSNSSSDSYEVVTDDPVLLHSSPFTSSKKSPAKPLSEESEKQSEDDLFSVCSRLSFPSHFPNASIQLTLVLLVHFQPCSNSEWCQLSRKTCSRLPQRRSCNKLLQLPLRRLLPIGQ